MYGKVYKVLDIEAINKMYDKEKGSCYALIKNVEMRTTRKGDPYFTGALCAGKDISFNCWNKSSAFEYFKASKPSAMETVVDVEFEVNVYGGTKSIVINDMFPHEGEVSVEELYPMKYDVKIEKNKFCDCVNACGCSKNGVKLLRKVLEIDVNDGLWRRFIWEFAAQTHHDNVLSGLLAHTTKCLAIYAGLRKQYEMFEDTYINDLMILGIALHDVGKVWEMLYGSYTDCSFVTHRGLGHEHLMLYKSAIVETYDEMFYDLLVSILLGHHDEYGEPARTVYAKIVHLIDNMEAATTSINEEVMNSPMDDKVVAALKFGDSYLSYLPIRTHITENEE